MLSALAVIASLNPHDDLAVEGGGYLIPFYSESNRNWERGRHLLKSHLSIRYCPTKPQDIHFASQEEWQPCPSIVDAGIISLSQSCTDVSCGGACRSSWLTLDPGWGRISDFTAQLAGVAWRLLHHHLVKDKGTQLDSTPFSHWQVIGSSWPSQWNGFPHLTDKETETHRGKRTHPKPYSLLSRDPNTGLSSKLVSLLCSRYPNPWG